MPLYEYRCSKCSSVFEVLQKFSDAPLKKHEKCGGKVEKLISASGLHFKGSGWYITDYARSGSGAPKSEGGGESKAETAKSETKTETNSEPKPKKDPAPATTKST